MKSSDCGCGSQPNNPPKDCSGGVPEINQENCSAIEHGDTCETPSQACDPKFGLTAPSPKLHLLGKRSVFSNCLHHFFSKTAGFLVNRPGGFQTITNDPDIELPLAQEVARDSMGQPLRDASGNFVLDQRPKFNKIFVSGVESEGCSISSTSWRHIKAPQTSLPLYLLSQDGYFKFGELNEGGLKTSQLPLETARGRILVIDEDDVCPDASGRRTWCVKEYKPNLINGGQALLVVSTDNAINKGLLTPVTTGPQTNGIIRVRDGKIVVSDESLDAGLQFVGPDGELIFANYDGLSQGDCALLKVDIGPNGSATASFRRMSDILNAFSPIGVPQPYLFSNLPSNDYLFLNGQVFNVNDYPAFSSGLAAAGLPANIAPDFRGRVAVGRDNIGGSASAGVLSAVGGGAELTLGGVLGQAQVTLTEAQIPEHEHEYLRDVIPRSGGRLGGDADPNGATFPVDEMANTESVGSGEPHTNIQPSITVNWIVKAR